MESTALAFALLAALAASGEADRPRPVHLDESFALHAGESATVESEKLEICFDRVVSDSRCPKGAQCLVEGDATVRITVKKASVRTSYELHTSERAAQEAGHDGLTIRLVRLDPQPVEGKAIEGRDYAATLLVTRGSSNPVAGRRP
jgi:hypothetical protein